jgi:hypothetical protein
MDKRISAFVAELIRKNPANKHKNHYKKKLGTLFLECLRLSAVLLVG